MSTRRLSPRKAGMTPHLERDDALCVAEQPTLSCLVSEENLPKNDDFSGFLGCAEETSREHFVRNRWILLGLHQFSLAMGLVPGIPAIHKILTGWLAEFFGSLSGSHHRRHECGP